LVFGRPDYLPPRQRYTYYPGTAIVPEQVAVNVRNRSHTITADVDIPPQGATGVLVAQGSLLGGWSLFLNDGHLRYVHNYVGLEEHRVDASVDLSAGPHRLAFHFEKTADLSGVGTLWVDGAQVGRGEIPRFTPIRFSLIGAGLSCGRDAGLTVTDDYPPGFPFTGRIHRVVIEVDGVPYVDPAAEAQLAIAEQ
jgi:arylsulfatase